MQHNDTHYFSIKVHASTLTGILRAPTKLIASASSSPASTTAVVWLLKISSLFSEFLSKGSSSGLSYTHTNTFSKTYI